MPAERVESVGGFGPRSEGGRPRSEDGASKKAGRHRGGGRDDARQDRGEKSRTIAEAVEVDRQTIAEAPIGTMAVIALRVGELLDFGGCISF